MKKILFTAVAALCLLAGGKLLAQDHALRVQIPFNFSVGNTGLPAGTYVLGRQYASQCAVVVRNTGTGEAIFNPARTDFDSPPEYPGRLVFHRYGDQYFLRELHGTFAETNLNLPVSSREKRAQEELTQVKVYEHITVPTEKD